MMMLPINFHKQILEGTFEYALNDIIDNHVDLSIFDHYYNNDEMGANAIHPSVLLKIILCAYSKGILSSRKIEEACKTNILFKALTADTTPDHSTIANFVSSMSEEIIMIFKDVLFICAQIDLIGGEVFALDGCKLSSNASKEWSGTFKELEKKKSKLDKTLNLLLKKHKNNDKSVDKYYKSGKIRIEKYNKKIEKIKSFLESNEKKMGKRGREKKSNITDNE